MIPVVLVEDGVSSLGDIINATLDKINQKQSSRFPVWHSDSDPNFSPKDTYKFSGIHCGTKTAAIQRAIDKHYEWVYEVTIPKNTKELVISDLGEDDSAKTILYRFANLDKSFRTFLEIFKMEFDSHEDYNRLLRGYVRYYDCSYLEYINNSEDKGSTSYLVVVPTVITVINKYHLEKDGTLVLVD